MILIGIFLSSLGIGLSGALMPGPLLSVAVAESYKKGFLAGPVIVAGHAVPELILAVVFTLGLNKFLNNDLAVGVIGVVGAIFLAWLSLKIFIEIRKGVEIDLSARKEVGWGPFFAGIWASVSNPGWIVWWATIGARYILLSLKHGLVGMAFFLSGHVMADLIWYSVVSFLVSKGRGRISTKLYHGLLYACSAMVMIFAFLFGINGIKTIMRS